MRTICLYFEIHQIIHLKRYRFFDIGNDHYYYDDYANETGMNEVAERSYIPALNALIEMVKNSGGAFKVALSISGVALEQLEIHAPAVIDLLHQLNETGCCEFLCEPYSHGLSSLANEDCFREEVLRQRDKMKQMFGKEPKVFRNSSLIYSDEIGGLVASMGFKGMLTEGAKHILGWKSPHYVYHCNQAPSLKLLLRDFKLSDDISLRFSNSDWAEYPLFADKYINWIDVLPQEEQVINIFMELSSLGMAQPLSSNILEFLKALPECAKAKGITFSTPTEIVTKLKSVSQLDVAYPMSWVDEERDTSCWLGNVMQREAFNKLYSVAERVHLCDDRRIKQDWDYLQASNNFRFMTTKNNGMWLNRGIYDSPYLAATFLALPVVFFGSAAAFLTSAFFAAGFDLATAFSFITGSLASAAFLTVVFFAASAFACHLATSFSNSVISSPWFLIVVNKEFNSSLSTSAGYSASTRLIKSPRIFI